MCPGHDLISGCLDNNFTAQKELYQRLAPGMLAICRRFTGDDQEAEDILQVGFTRLFLNLHQYRHEGDIEAWARRIMVNTAINHIKQKPAFCREIDVEELAQEGVGSGLVWPQITSADLNELIRNLPNKYRIVFILHEIEGYDHKEIGALLGIRQGTSKSLLHRARAVLQKRLRTMGITG